MGDMSQDSLVADLKSTLNQAAEFFKTAADADYKRHLDAAAADMSRIRPRILKATLTLASETSEYDAPANIKRVTRTDWGRAERKQRQPWNADYIHDLPDLSVIETDSGTKLELSREITAAELADIGGGQHQQHARHGPRRRGLHAQHPRRGVRRAQQHQMRRAMGGEIIDIAASAGQKAFVLKAVLLAFGHNCSSPSGIMRAAPRMRIAAQAAP